MSQNSPLAQFALVRQPEVQMLMEQYWLAAQGVGFPMHDEVPGPLLHALLPVPPPPVPFGLVALLVTVHATTVRVAITKNARDAIERDIGILLRSDDRITESRG
jgi:hypothetical protein